jgi:hypothetical protein
MAMIEALKKLVARIPGRAWLAVGCLLVAAFWLQQHDARIRQQAEVQQLRSQTSAEVAALRKQAAQDVKQANVENAKEIAKLEQRRQQVVQQNRTLAAQLARLREQAQIQAGKVATLPISQIVNRVTTQLGLNGGDVAPAGVRNQGLCDLCGPKASTQRAQRSSVSSVLRLFNPQSAQRRLKEQITNYELKKPAVTATAESHTSQGPRRMRHPAISAPLDRGGRGALGVPAGGQSPPLQSPAVLPLTDSGARKVEAALVDLHACRAESDIKTQQISNCQARAEADEAEVKRLNDSVAGLNRALEAKDKILDRQSNECKAELRAAKGTFLGRLARLTEHVAVGVAIGVAIGVAVK